MAHFFTRNMFAVRVMMDVAEGHRNLQLDAPHVFFPHYLPACYCVLLCCRIEFGVRGE